jgi:hypothetical protein
MMSQLLLLHDEGEWVAASFCKDLPSRSHIEAMLSNSAVPRLSVD